MDGMRSSVAFLYIAAAACGGSPGQPSDAAPGDAVSPGDAEAPGDGAVALDDAPGVASLCGLTPTGSWQRCQADPLIEGTRPAADPGKLEWTQADPSVMYDADDHLWKAWWSTVVFADCSQVTSDRELDIKYAESDDGVTWRIQAEPVLRSHRDPGDWDYTTTETPTVIKVPGAVPARRDALRGRQ
jgi:hypothetical protein